MISDKWRLRTWNSEHIFQVDLWMVGQQHSRWLFKFIFKQIAKKILKLKVEARPVNKVPIWLSNIALQVAIDSESCQRSFSSFCSPPSQVAVLLYWNLSSLPFLGQVVDFDLLFCTGRIRLAICGFVPMLLFNSETNEWSKDWAKWWTLLWSITGYPHFHHQRKFHVT